jgi:hypothetical protein
LQSRWRIGTAGIVFVPGIKYPYYSIIEFERTETAMPAPSLPTIAKKRRSYIQRSGNQTRAASALYRAFNTTPSFVEDADGHRIRQWEGSEIYALRHDDIKAALSRRGVLVREDLLEFVPSGSITYAVNKGWVVKDSRPGADWFYVTKKAAVDLDLPRKDREGRKIRFLDNGL